MVIWTSAINVAGSIPQTITYIYSLFLGYGISFQYTLSYNISIGLHFFTHSINIFIYYKLNKMFRNTLIGYFRCNLFSKYLSK